jgi:hypothetical protein
VLVPETVEVKVCEGVALKVGTGLPVAVLVYEAVFVTVWVSVAERLAVML